MKIRTVVVDDEPLARRRLARLLEGEEGLEVVSVCATGREAVRAVREESPELLFLDVQMPEMDGFAVLRELEGQGLPQVVFVTAYDQYAIQAFEVHALDYLLKPYTPARLATAVQRAARQLSAPRAAPAERLAELLEHLERERRALDVRLSGSAPAPGQTTRLLVKEGERMFFVPVDRIDWLEAEGNYVRLHCGKDAHLVRATLSGMEEQLDPRRFTRIHRSTIVNVDRVAEIRSDAHGDFDVLLANGKVLRMTRGYSERLLS